MNYPSLVKKVCGMTDNDRLRWINSASLKDLLRKWSLATTNDPLFKGAIGTYYASVLYSKKQNTPVIWDNMMRGMVFPSIEGFNDIEPARVMKWHTDLADNSCSNPNCYSLETRPQTGLCETCYNELS